VRRPGREAARMRPPQRRPDQSPYSKKRQTHYPARPHVATPPPKAQARAPSRLDPPLRTHGNAPQHLRPSLRKDPSRMGLVSQDRRPLPPNRLPRAGHHNAPSTRRPAAHVRRPGREAAHMRPPQRRPDQSPYSKKRQTHYPARPHVTTPPPKAPARAPSRLDPPLRTHGNAPQHLRPSLRKDPSRMGLVSQPREPLSPTR
jgi:hypothetical protein